MDAAELIAKVRKIEIKTKGISRDLFSGEYHSVFKGRGMAFSEVREYQVGDDIRSIDWNVTARLNHPYIKVFEEERELTVMLLVDVSESESFGTSTMLKKEMITELVAVLAFSAIQNNDKIGMILFSNKIEKFIPPKKGRTHILRIIRELLEFKPENSVTDVSTAISYFLNVIKKRSIVFIISDFFSPPFEEPLKISSKKHDTIAVNIYDIRESSIPDIGLAFIKDAETQKRMWVDTSSKEFRKRYEQWWNSKQNYLKNMFKMNGVDLIQLRTDESFIKPLQKFFREREKRK